ncbi:streptomycin 6-kinase [Saccharothrix coeruleofusca]|uniref:aminoglycoside phosphotransferase family protein n=1 Tax=Saccharothrix coeruleofusca TaxID=33919 RepID=UPI001AE4E23F|nr:aminoglycoside phosphotransferase family protein [Saccharothrix coeruleofusca]MBP2336340.1 streptomycin 6-kinase [Saccharothrix coeruleofusca]
MSERLLSRFGPGVRAWLEALPDLVDALARRWGLEVVRPMSGGTSHTLLCTREGTTVVLKLTPDTTIAAEEHAALRAWEPSPRVVRVLEADVPAGALLLEGLVPGTQVGSSGGVVAVPVRRLADLLRELHTPPPPPGLPTLAQRVDYIFDLFRRRRPEQDYSAAHAAAAALAGDRVPTRLLHGDLHLGNVLDGGARGLVVIDPRPCVGDPAVDAVDFAYAGPDLRARIEALSAVVDGDRLAAWCAAFAPYFPSQPA